MSPVPEQSPSFKFPYQFIRTNIGRIPYPVVPIILNYRFKSLKFDFIIDTGADITTLPKYIADEFKIDLSKLPTSASQGVGKGLTKTWETKLNLILGDQKLKVRCSFVESNKIPPLLGKLDIFAKFNFYFDNDRQELVVTRIKNR